MKLLNIMAALLISISVGGCAFIKPSFIDENYFKIEEEFTQEDSILPEDIGPLGGHFDEDGNWIPDDEEIELTYKLPDISVGSIFDINSLNVSPSIQIELFEIDSHIPYISTIKVDLGVAYQRTYIYVGKLFTSIFEISAGGFVGWNFEDKEISYGIGFTIIRF